MITKQELSDKYDDLYQRACDLNDRFNLCNIQNGVCARGVFCCGQNVKPLCKFLDKNNCKTQNLYCKLWICRYLEDTVDIDTLEEYEKEERIIFNSASRYYLISFRESKENTINKALEKFKIGKFYANQ